MKTEREREFFFFFFPSFYFYFFLSIKEPHFELDKMSIATIITDRKNLWNKRALKKKKKKGFFMLYTPTQKNFKKKKNVGVSKNQFLIKLLTEKLKNLINKAEQD